MGFPNVPVAPGVPPLPRAPGAAAAAIALLTADLVATLTAAAAPSWGIFLNGAPVVSADCTVSFTFSQDYDVSTYPQEQGAFQSYDKVQKPFDVRVRYAAGGSAANRAALQASIDAIIGSLQLFDVVTPEKTFRSVNPTHQDLKRTAENGVGLIQVDVYCVQVRVTGTQQFSSTQQPSGAASANPGTQQAQPPAPAQAAIPQSAYAGTP